MATKRKAPEDPNKAALDARAADLTARTGAFCDAHLDAEYKALCAKLIAKMRRKRVVPFATGRPEIWAASVVTAIVQINFGFDLGAKPHTTGDEIATFFGTSKSTVGLKAKAIRDEFALRHWDPEFSVKHVAESNPMRTLMRALAGLPVVVVHRPKQGR